MANLALFLTRLTLGGLFFLAGLRKLIPQPGRTLLSNLEAFVNGTVVPASPLPVALSKTYGYALPFVELLAGLMLALGLFTRLNATLIMLLLVSFIIAIGPQWWPAQGSPFHSNVVLVTVALLLASIGPGKYSLDSKFLSRRATKIKQP